MNPIRLKISSAGFLLTCFVFFMFLLTLKGLPGNLHPNGVGTNKIKVNSPPFETSMERGRFAQVIALAETGTLKVNSFYKFLEPDLAWYNNNFYSTFPPGVAFIAFPFYLLGRVLNLSQILTFLTSAVFTTLTVYLIYIFCQSQNLSKRTSVLAGLIFAFTSSTWAYSISLSAHPVSAFIMLLGCIVAQKIARSENNLKYFMVIGTLFGLCLFVDYPNILIFLPILIYSVGQKMFSFAKDATGKVLEIQIPRGLIYLVLSFALFFVLFVTYNINTFQKPIAFTNTYSIKYLQVSEEAKSKMQLNNDIFKDKDYSKRFSLNSTLEGINTLLFSKDRGLFFYAPIYLLAILGLPIMFRKNLGLTVTGLLTFILNLLIYASYDDPWGGWSFGPRYLTATLPILVIFVAHGIEFLFEKRISLAKLGIFALLIYSFAIAAVGAFTTNAVPTSVEAKVIGMQDNFMYNWNYLTDRGISSFIYKTVFAGVIPPIWYAGTTLAVLVFTTGFVIFKKAPYNPQSSSN